MTRVTSRNIVLLVGAYYLAALLGMPFFIVFAKMAEGHGYTRVVSNDPASQLGDVDGAALLASLVDTIPLAVDAILAALMAGWLVESSTPRRWAWGLAALLFVAGLSGHHWFRPPSVEDRVGQLLDGVVPALVAVPVFMAVRTRFRRVEGAA